MIIKNDDEMLQYCRWQQRRWRGTRWGILVISGIFIAEFVFLIVLGLVNGKNMLEGGTKLFTPLIVLVWVVTWAIIRWNGDPVHKYIVDKRSKNEA